MKALPSRFSEEWHDSQVRNRDRSLCGVRFCIRPLTNRIRSHIQSATTTYQETGECDECGKKQYEQIVEGGTASYDTVGFGLVAIEGLTDSELNIPFVLERKPVKMGAVTIDRVTDECLDRMPAFLFDEILATVNLASIATAEEIENANFTPPSSPETTSTTAETAQEMSEPAPTDASPDSHWPGG